MSEDGPSLGRGSAALLISMIVAGFLSVATSIIVAKSIGAHDFGVYSILFSIQGVVGLFAGFGMGNTLPKFVAEYRAKNENEALAFAKAGFVISVTISSISCVAYVVLSGFIGNQLYHEPRIVGLIPISAAVVASGAIFGTVFAIIQGCQRIKFLAYIRISNALLTVAAVVAFVTLFGIVGALTGFLVGQIAVTLAALYWINRTGFHFVRDRTNIPIYTEAKTLLKFSIPIVASSILVWPVFWIGNTFLTLAEGFLAMGYFAVAFLVFQSFAIVPQSVSIPLIPKISELTVDSKKDIPHVLNHSLRSMAVLLLIPILTVSIFSSQIFGLFFSGTNAAAGHAISIMAIMSYAFALVTVMDALIIGTGRPVLWLALNASWALTYLATLVFTVPRFGIEGLALTFLISYLVRLTMTNAALSRLCDVNIKPAFRTFLLGAFLLVVSYFISSEPTPLIVKLGFVLIAGLLVVLSERSVLREIIRDIRSVTKD